MEFEDTAKVTRLVVFAFWAVVLIGIPFWWKTTEIYRANLPFSEIEAWYSKQACDLVMPTQFTIFIPKSLNIQQTTLDINDSLKIALSNKKYNYNFPIEVKVEVADGYADTNNVPISSYFIRIEKGEKQEAFVGNDRISVMKLKELSSSRIAEALSTFIPTVYLDENEKIGGTACHVDTKTKNDIASMRTLQYSSKYETTFSLMNNNPENVKMDWDIREAVDQYLQPFLNEISVVSNFTINSQIQNYAPLTLKPNYREITGKPNYYYFQPQHLPHFVNSAEWNLASTITSHLSINFILYVPSQEESPLRIHDSKDQPLRTNAFLVPRWGGIVIKNAPKTAKGEYRFTSNGLEPVMKLFLSQLRGLIGIRDHDESIASLPHLDQIYFENAEKTGITTLEKDNLIRIRTVENVVNTISTLKSLAQLVEEIPNMVVEDHISYKVHASLNALASVHEVLDVEKDYIKALQTSIEAIELAEMAFFDPTMVSMLYFPDEHKYAIYMPLFVPISVPLLMALLKELKKYKEQRKQSSKDKKE
ncbi:phosphatidylinositol-glycan biosynthesis class S protein [Mycotypha africana]|uniref:phosphatidylinositol-glycan biosynthesis class S protein n=1 Tax=Mycotypha africana TaxID=64632 RepID=UPI002300BC87|nr:phosphatidylinositol-glycan biosynthesis class S protein [Mycotypha africana]KAI8981885.1 phosphatidylinositol-glycan biosynthesis class S protein [Mycotypha africana]